MLRFTCTYIQPSRFDRLTRSSMNRPLYAKIIGTISVLIILLGVGIAVTTRAGVVAAAPSTYSLKFSGYDFDGQNEITLALNNVTIGQFPAIFNTANAATSAPYSHAPLTIPIRANTLDFTHSIIDRAVPDYVNTLTVFPPLMIVRCPKKNETYFAALAVLKMAGNWPMVTLLRASVISFWPSKS